MSALRLPWPAGIASAMCLTFDIDAETMWTSDDPANARRPAVISQGLYEVEVGVPLILELLARNELHATFFIPGWVVERHPEMVAAICDGGHELGHHGYRHDSMDGADAELEHEVLLQGLDALQRVAGVRPRGYRAPLFDVNEHTWELLRREGFIYSSNLMHTIWPTVHPGEPPLVEIPVQWMLDDGQYYLTRRYPPNYRQPYSPAGVLEIWEPELKAIHGLGGVTTIVFHPQLSGRPSRVEVIQSLIDTARELPGMWMPTLGELAATCLALSEVVDQPAVGV
jgi:peptidoglycan/xylan/chitin deacetylase (PgdA/CDA1 family)